MPRMTEQIAAMIGVQTADQLCCDDVERGAVRRFAQAIGDLDPIYTDREYASRTRYREPVAPPLFPLAMLRLPFGGPDQVDLRANDPDFDGAAESATYGLPSIPLENSPIVNGGIELELHRYVNHGEPVHVRARYKDIYEKETSKGWFIFIVYEVQYIDRDGLPIMTINRTQIRR
jgi:uncharacterized protein